jgi:hypothetical protein
MRRGVFVLVTFAAAIVFAACSTSSDSSSGAPADVTGSCAVLASQCHPYDKETAIGHECHELGHDGTDSACAVRKAECIAACPLREAGPTPTTDASVDPEGGAEGGADAAPDTFCADYCTCLTDTCATVAEYPFAAAGSCEAHCAVLSAAERACWPKFCADAKASTTNKVHLCEHAWGKLGLDECP